jgi:hypothetical protein
VSRARATLVGWVVGRVSRLRFPVLFSITASLFLVNLVVPDAIPLVDEMLLGLGAAVLASWRKRNVPDAAGSGRVGSRP